MVLILGLSSLVQLKVRRLNGVPASKTMYISRIHASQDVKNVHFYMSYI